MTSATSMFQVGSVVLGYVGITASWRRLAPRQTSRGVDYRMLVITSSGGVEEGTYEPPASIALRSREGLLALRDAIDEALKEPTE